MRSWLENLYGWYVQLRRGRIEHPLFGTLEMSHCIPRINMYWWESVATFPPVDSLVTIDLHSPSTGPNELQIMAYQNLIARYEQLSATGRSNGNIPGEDQCRLKKITLFVHGHIDLHYDMDGSERIVYADSNAEYLTPEIAARH